LKAVIDEDPEARVLMPFNPTFTYPIFGEKEKIYGYKGLQIEVRSLSILRIEGIVLTE
jgi:hypothetical protein